MLTKYLTNYTRSNVFVINRDKMCLFTTQFVIITIAVVGLTLNNAPFYKVEIHLRYILPEEIVKSYLILKNIFFS